ncbi:replication initiation protein [Solirubrobacter taibaiensis]|nr:replication initiation protein [Solirubrobacter taibaiensis]
MTTALQNVLARAADPDEWERFERQLRATGYCRRPLRLKGRVDSVDPKTGEVVRTYSTEDEPDGTLLKCCGNRREAVCPSCAEVYRGDAYQLVASGMRGGKGVPESVTEHPMVFLTLTAPSFGPVHSRRVDGGQARRCRPRRDGGTCPHGLPVGCSVVHDEDDERLGEPICAECFDYEHAVLWNALAPELWRRTAIQLPRELARLVGVSQKKLRVRVSYVKVAEFQRRGALHFHCVLRLDGLDDNGEVVAPPARFTEQLLIDAAQAAARHASFLSPAPPNATGRPIRWGGQVDARALDEETSKLTARYLAKYATKSTEAVGGLLYRLEGDDIDRLRVRPHVQRYVKTAWNLALRRELHPLKLRRWAHSLGFRGHCFTKSRRYSTTFTALRQARHEHVLRRNGELRDRSSDVRRWHYSGSGYRTPGDAWLAESGRKRAVEQRRVAREELRTNPLEGRRR